MKTRIAATPAMSPSVEQPPSRTGRTSSPRVSNQVDPRARLDARDRQPDSSVPPIVHDVLGRGGQPIEPTTRAFMESRFGHDFARVRVHADSKAEESARALNAHAYTVGKNVVFGAGRYAPGTSQGNKLLAHELTHVVHQRDGPLTGIRPVPSTDPSEAEARGVASRIDDQDVAVQSSTYPLALYREENPLDGGAPPAAPTDAGVTSLPGGIPDPPTTKAIPDLNDFELGPAYQAAIDAGQSDRAEAIDQEMDKRSDGWGTAAPRGPAPVTGGAGAVTPDVALELLNNMAKGDAPFKPGEGLGGSSWFTTEGNPYTSTSPAKNINVQVEIAKGSNPLTFREADLVAIWNAEAGPAAIQAEAEYRAKFNIADAVTLSNRASKAIKRTLPRFTEKRMWTRVGEQVAASTQKVGEVILQDGSQFSDTPGKFAVVADAGKITLKGGTAGVVDALSKAGVTAEPVVVEAAEALANSLKWAGRVQNVFRYGGRVMIVVAVTMDVIKIYRAKDRVKTTITTLGGWGGATAAGSAFAALWTPGDLAGPWAWVVHGVGTLVAGGVGYWVGTEVTRTVYELVVDES